MQTSRASEAAGPGRAGVAGLLPSGVAMVKDIEPVQAGTATIAARLCNFKTAQSDPLYTHRQWLDANVIPAIRNSPNPWVDIFGYASRLGDPTFNKKLSDKRCAAVVQHIRSSVPRVSFPQQFGYGEDRSGGGVNDNDGFWRAVELYVYAAGRPSVPDKPKPPPPEPQVLVRGDRAFRIECRSVARYREASGS